MNCVCKYTLGTSGQLELSFQLPGTHILNSHETHFLQPFPSVPFLQGESVNLEDFAYNSAMKYLVLGVTVARLCTHFQPCFSSYHFSFWSQWMFIFLKLKYSGYLELTSMEDATRRSLANCKNVWQHSKGEYVRAEPL